MVLGHRTNHVCDPRCPAEKCSDVGCSDGCLGDRFEWVSSGLRWRARSPPTGIARSEPCVVARSPRECDAIALGPCSGHDRCRCARRHRRRRPPRRCGHRRCPLDRGAQAADPREPDHPDASPGDDARRAREAAPVLVSASAVGYYGDRGDEIVTEESGPGTDFAADVCGAVGGRHAPAADAGIRVVKIRTGIVLGAGGGVLGKLLLPFKLGLGGRVGDGRPVHVVDLAPRRARSDRARARHGRAGRPGEPDCAEPGDERRVHRNARRRSSTDRRCSRRRCSRSRRGSARSSCSTCCSRPARPPARLEASGFEFAHPTLEEALHAVLDRPAPAT